MEPLPVPESARVVRLWCRLVIMGPPRGVSDADCGTAQMLVGSESEIPGFPSGRANYVYYRPSPAEMQMLAEGGFIEFAQYGQVVQPFSATVWPAGPD
jgi:hypothetical protein